VSLPAGVYSVRFICDDEQECRDFGVKRAKKKLEVKPDEEVRFTADFYDINGNNEGR